MKTPMRTTTLIAAVLLAACQQQKDVASTPAAFANVDLYTEFLPRHAFAGAALRRGELPLWDAHQIGGLPFLAARRSRCHSVRRRIISLTCGSLSVASPA